MSEKPKLSRQMGLFAVVATGVSSMVGASINVVPFMIHRSVPSIGPYVLWAFIFAAIPALFAGLSYAILSSAMPRAGGSYLYASRGLNPYLGFVASFSQWFGLSIVIGVIAYISIPFLRDIAYSYEFFTISKMLDVSWIRVSLSLSFIWSFVYVNIKGIKSYTNLLIPMVIVIFSLGSIVILSSLFYDIELIDKFKSTDVGKNCESFEKLSIKQTLPIIKNCNLAICNDTGFAHIACALGVKTLTLFMDSPVMAYGKYSSRMEVIEPEGEKNSTVHNTLGKDKISYQRVLHKVNQMLN